MNQDITAESHVKFLTIFASILFRCFIFTSIAMVLVWGVVALAHDPIEALHESLFGISAHEFDLFLYGFLTLIKCLNVVLFLFPWLAIRHYLFIQSGIK